MRYNPNVNESNLNVQSILFENKCSISNSTDSYIAHRQKVRVILVTNESGYYSISLTLALAHLPTSVWLSPILPDITLLASHTLPPNNEYCSKARIDLFMIRVFAYF